MKITIEIDSNFDIDIDTFTEIMNEKIMSDSDFIRLIASSSAYFGHEVIKLKVLENIGEKQ